MNMVRSILTIVLVMLGMTLCNCGTSKRHIKDLPDPNKPAKKVELPMEIPIYHRPDKSERPADCPKSQMSEIIKACSNECHKDRDCPSRRKCCWNGCARRCTKPLIKDPTNYLNLPLLTNDD